jgi:hypothetical protein
MRRLILLNLPICAMLTFLFGAAFHIRGTEPPASPVDVCSENPYYAEAIVAQQYVPSGNTSYIYGGHAYLDGLYQSLLEEGKIEPVPPPCLITAQRDTLIFPSLDSTTAPAGVLYTGQSAAIYGRNSAGTWWYIASAVGYGWISDADSIIQPETEVDLVPVLY